LTPNSSEIVKLLSNAFLAQRISSINSLTEFCEATNSNINKISIAVGKDKRIGSNYLKASMGFGGSCLQKDLLSLIYLLQTKNLDVQANYWSQVLLMNEYQRLRICKAIVNKISTAQVAIFGLSFKGNINDVRSANSVFMTNYLTYNNIKVKLFDPFVKFSEFCHEIKMSRNNYVETDFENEKLIEYYEDYQECLKGCNTVVFCNDHSIFQSMFKINDLYDLMDKPSYIFDCYDNFSLENMKLTNMNVFKLGEYNSLIENQK